MIKETKLMSSGTTLLDAWFLPVVLLGTVKLVDRIHTRQQIRFVSPYVAYG